MHQAIQAGEIFALADLVPYQDGKIVNMDVVNSDHLKFVVMAFDDGSALAEHAAPGEALVFALEGRAEIGYEGETHPIAAGENFLTWPGAKSSVRSPAIICPCEATMRWNSISGWWCQRASGVG